MKGLTAKIFKCSYGSCDGKANFSSKVDKVTIIPNSDFPNIPQIFEASEKAPAVVVVKRPLFGKIYLTAYPILEDGSVDVRMSGGCFISTSDSRFPAEYPIPLHDRIE